MIYLYSGTPGSGKSLHTAQQLYERLQKGKVCICNFDININNIKPDFILKLCNRLPTITRKEFIHVDNEHLTPKLLIKYSKWYFKKHKFREGKLLLVIDECQLLFNAREWQKSGRSEWLSFFTQHRKYGYDIILIAQFDRMIDRQIRSLIEYEYIHRKVSNYGIAGKLIKVATFGELFVCVQMWYPLHEKIMPQFFKAHKKYYSIYDSYDTF